MNKITKIENYRNVDDSFIREYDGLTIPLNLSVMFRMYDLLSKDSEYGYSYLKLFNDLYERFSFEARVLGLPIDTLREGETILIMGLGNEKYSYETKNIIINMLMVTSKILNKINCGLGVRFVKSYIRGEKTLCMRFKNIDMEFTDNIDLETIIKTIK